MLGRLILILLQIAVAWYAAPAIAGRIPVPSDFSLFLYAVIYAVIVFLVGFVGSIVLRDIGRPGSATLTMTLVVALIAAGLATWGPQLLTQIPWARANPHAPILAGAILGYIIRR